MTSQKIGLTTLRLSLAFVFLWFGFSQISDVTTWTSFVPEFMTRFVDAGLLVILNGSFEVVAGLLIAFNVLVKPLAILLGIHLFFIAISIGLTAVGVRDIGLGLASISLGILYTKNSSRFFQEKIPE